MARLLKIRGPSPGRQGLVRDGGEQRFELTRKPGQTAKPAVPEDDEKVWQMAEEALKRHGRSESLVLFDGTWEMSYEVKGCTMKMDGKDIPRVATYWGMHGWSTWLRYFHVMVADANETLSTSGNDVAGRRSNMRSSMRSTPSQQPCFGRL